MGVALRAVIARCKAGSSTIAIVHGPQVLILVCEIEVVVSVRRGDYVYQSAVQEGKEKGTDLRPVVI